MDLQIQIDRLSQELATLANFSSYPAPAVTRIVYSQEDQQARVWLRQRCHEAGLTVREDPIGNMFARWPGSDPQLAPVVSGSHIDAIPNAGAYDGTVGVLGVLEAIRALQQAGFQPRRSIELMLCTSEEPTRFGLGCLGSRAIAGSLSAEQLQLLRDGAGHDLDSLRLAAGFTGDLAEVAQHPGAIHAFVELHIEQGPLLEAAQLPIGIVRAIAAPASLRIELQGVGGHAGATLMPGRRDALLAGAEIALAVEQAVLQSGSPDTVGTTGVFRVEPGAINSIPSRAILEIDVRDINLESRDQVLRQITTAVETICTRRQVEWRLTTLNADPPAHGDAALINAVAESCEQLGLPYQLMVSRAYHDSLFMARICPITMIFIPCRGGVSHRPDEYSSPAQIATGVLVLAHTLARLSR